MPHIIPIKNLKNTSEISEMCHNSDEPVYVTKNGYGDMVIMSMDTYESLAEKIQMYQSLMVSEQQIKTGETLDAKKSLEALRKKYDL